MKTIFRHTLLAATLGTACAVAADGPPDFFKNTLPENAIADILKGYGALQGEGAALDPKVRELIALAVAAQIPCEYCVHAHRSNALSHGATDAELREAAAVAGYVRMWSTVLHGAAYSLESFKAEHDAM